MWALKYRRICRCVACVAKIDVGSKNLKRNSAKSDFRRNQCVTNYIMKRHTEVKIATLSWYLILIFSSLLMLFMILLLILFPILILIRSLSWTLSWSSSLSWSLSWSFCDPCADPCLDPSADPCHDPHPGTSICAFFPHLVGGAEHGKFIVGGKKAVAQNGQKYNSCSWKLYKHRN